MISKFIGALDAALQGWWIMFRPLDEIAAGRTPIHALSGTAIRT